MKKSASFITFIFFLMAINLSSCGGGPQVAKKTFNINAQLSEEHSIPSSELNIATRICYAYQSKSINFRSSGYINTGFNFKGKQTDCSGAIVNYSINSVLKYDTANELTYALPFLFDQNLNFFKTVQTDTAGYLIQICSKIKNNETISNTVTEQGVKVQISFFREDLDGFFLQYFTQQTNGSYKITSAEKFKVRTLLDFTSGKILGMDEFYAAQKICNSQLDTGKFSEFSQEFLGR